MKTIYLFVALLFFTASAKSQNNLVDLTAILGFEKDSVAKWNALFNIRGFSFPKYGTIKLPQDNMPCFIPDVSSIAVMPTLKTVSPYQAIPNPYFNYNNAPEITANSLPR
jgi:hypothetical protein